MKRTCILLILQCALFAIFAMGAPENNSIYILSSAADGSLLTRVSDGKIIQSEKVGSRPIYGITKSHLALAMFEHDNEIPGTRVEIVDVNTGKKLFTQWYAVSALSALAGPTNQIILSANKLYFLGYSGKGKDFAYKLYVVDINDGELSGYNIPGRLKNPEVIKAGDRVVVASLNGDGVQVFEPGTKSFTELMPSGFTEMAPQAAENVTPFSKYLYNSELGLVHVTTGEVEDIASGDLSIDKAVHKVFPTGCEVANASIVSLLGKNVLLIASANKQNCIDKVILYDLIQKLQIREITLPSSAINIFLSNSGSSAYLIPKNEPNTVYALDIATGVIRKVCEIPYNIDSTPQTARLIFPE